MKYGDATHKVDYAYDGFGRLNTRKVYNGSTSTPILTSQYTYNAGGFTQDGKTFSSNQVQKIEQEHIAFTYTYDSVGNIVSELRNYKATGTTKVTTYAYDALGQLIRVNDQNDTTSGASGTTWVYLYDRGGNILSKSRYAYAASGTTVGTRLEYVPYTYGDSNWKDKLTAYNGVAITYDAIGNPLNDGTWTYGWTAGRQLRYMTKSDATISFQYDHNGLRSQKEAIVGSTTTTTDYTYHGKLLVAMTRGSDVLRFEYDAQSRPSIVMFNGTRYAYLHNLQGDIVGIMDSTGSLVVEYRYDAWGKPLSTTGSMASTLGAVNPLRYRGYVYDSETGLYYLITRYFSCAKSRFENVDVTLGAVGGTLHHNVFSYCQSNSVNFVDENGQKRKTYLVGSVDYSISEAEIEARAVFDAMQIDYPSDVQLGWCFDGKTRDGLYDVYLFYYEPGFSSENGYCEITYAAYRIYNAPEVVERKANFFSNISDILGGIAPEIPKYGNLVELAADLITLYVMRLYKRGYKYLEKVTFTRAVYKKSNQGTKAVYGITQGEYTEQTYKSEYLKKFK